MYEHKWTLSYRNDQSNRHWFWLFIYSNDAYLQEHCFKHALYKWPNYSLYSPIHVMISHLIIDKIGILSYQSEIIIKGMEKAE